MERLKAVRHTLNVSQTVFAKSIFLGKSQYACLESGHRKIKETVLDSISKVHGVNKEWLLTGNGNMFDSEPPDAKLEELINIYKKLNSHFQEYIIDQIKNLERIQQKELKKR